MAVGVGFGALNNIDSNNQAAITQQFNSARTLAIGIGLQNFPEGLAVSLPLIRVGYSKNEAFMYGQLSGLVEPIGGLLGAYLVVYIIPLLPYALAFAAGAMIFVVIDDLIPETRSAGGYSELANWGCIIGFIVMMSMDVALG
jgi:zinc transporter 11